MGQNRKKSEKSFESFSLRGCNFYEKLERTHVAAQRCAPFAGIQKVLSFVRKKTFWRKKVWFAIPKWAVCVEFFARTQRFRRKKNRGAVFLIRKKTPTKLFRHRSKLKSTADSKNSVFRHFLASAIELKWKLCPSSEPTIGYLVGKKGSNDSSFLSQFQKPNDHPRDKRRRDRKPKSRDRISCPDSDPVTFGNRCTSEEKSEKVYGKMKTAFPHSSHSVRVVHASYSYTHTHPTHTQI